MISQIDGLIGLVSAATRIRPQEGSSVSSKPQETASNSEDTLDLSSEQVVDAVRVQAGALQTELPGLLAEALLAPITDSATQAEPLNNLLFRLINPLESILGHLPSEDLPENLILGLQEEVRNFRDSIPQLANSTLISQLSADSVNAEPLNALLNQLSSPLDDLLTRLGALG